MHLPGIEKMIIRHALLVERFFAGIAAAILTLGGADLAAFHLQGRAELETGIDLVGIPVDPEQVPDLAALLAYRDSTRGLLRARSRCRPK